VDPHAEQQLGGWELTGGASSSYWPHDSDQLGGASQPVFLAEQMQLKDEAAMQPTLSMWPESWQMPWPESLHMLAWDVPGPGSVRQDNAETPAASAAVTDGFVPGLWGDHDQARHFDASVLEAENWRLRRENQTLVATLARLYNDNEQLRAVQTQLGRGSTEEPVAAGGEVGRRRERKRRVGVEAVKRTCDRTGLSWQ
jgi:hypothetical protein